MVYPLDEINGHGKNGSWSFGRFNMFDQVDIADMDSTVLTRNFAVLWNVSDHSQLNGKYVTRAMIRNIRIQDKRVGLYYDDFNEMFLASNHRQKTMLVGCLMTALWQGTEVSNLSELDIGDMLRVCTAWTVFERDNNASWMKDQDLFFSYFGDLPQDEEKETIRLLFNRNTGARIKGIFVVPTAETKGDCSEYVLMTENGHILSDPWNNVRRK